MLTPSKVNEAVKPGAEAPVAAAPPVASAPSKQEVMFAKLKAAWVARGVDLSKMTATLDGKYMIVEVGEGWPTIQIGSNGGIDLPQIKSFARAFDAAVDADKLLAKQQARDAKKGPKKPAAPAPKVDGKEGGTQADADQQKGTGTRADRTEARDTGAGVRWST